MTELLRMLKTFQLMIRQNRKKPNSCENYDLKYFFSRALDLITRAIEKNDFLSNYMDNDRKKRVIDAMVPDYYEKGEFIIRENDIGSEIFVSEKGSFEIIKGDEIIDTLGSEIVFGELAILYNAKRFASVRAATKVKVWKIQRQTFRNIMLVSGNKEREENLRFLRGAKYLQELPESCIVKIVDLLKRVCIF